MEPEISIIIPVYNGATFLHDCLESVFRQQADESWFEVIVVDDGSTDLSSTIVNEWQLSHGNLRLVQQENQGVSVARNTGLHLANGNFICFLDVDDLFFAGGFEALAKQDVDNIDVVMMDSYIQTGDNMNNRYVFPSEFDEKVLRGIEVARIYDKASVAGVLFDRIFISKHGICFAPGLANGEDLLFLAQAFLYADQVVHFSIPFYQVVRTSHSESQQWEFQRLMNNLQISVDFLNNIKKNELLDKEQRDLLAVTAYRVFSFGIWFFLRTKCYSRFPEVKSLIKDSDFWPVQQHRSGDKGFKIKVFNFSLSLFSLLVFIKNKKQ